MNIWGCYRNTLADLCTKKIRRCLGLESVGVMDNNGALESFSIFSVVLSGCGFADIPSGLDIDELVSLVDLAAKSRGRTPAEGRTTDASGFLDDLSSNNSLEKMIKNINDISKGGFAELGPIMERMNNFVDKVAAANDPAIGLSVNVTQPTRPGILGNAAPRDEFLAIRNNRARAAVDDGLDIGLDNEHAREAAAEGPRNNPLLQIIGDLEAPPRGYQTRNAQNYKRKPNCCAPKRPRNF